MTLAFDPFAKGVALDYSVGAQSEDTFEIDVTRCRYAQFYKELGEPELGFWLAARTSHSPKVWARTSDSGAHKRLRRTQTVMQGASHCDVRYKRQKD